jgi:hypothetical protein
MASRFDRPVSDLCPISKTDRARENKHWRGRALSPYLPISQAGVRGCAPTHARARVDIHRTHREIGETLIWRGFPVPYLRVLSQDIGHGHG